MADQDRRHEEHVGDEEQRQKQARGALQQVEPRRPAALRARAGRTRTPSRRRPAAGALDGRQRRRIASAWPKVS